MPPKVEYTLTAYGVTVNNIVEVMCSWGKENIKMRQQQGEDIVLLEDKPQESFEDFRKIDS
ncbi:HxlR-like helix-turn-helix [compost metagenome]